MRAPVAVLSICLACGAAVASGGDLEVVIVKPEIGQAVFGEVEVEAQVYPHDAAVTRVEFFLDSRFMGRVEARPFVMALDVGQENVEHHFYVVAHDAGGNTAESVVMTSPIPSDLEVDVELQQLYITVERGGERVLDLRREDFAIFEDGVPQRTITFERGDIPFTAALLVDASTSMRGKRLRTALAGAEAFVRGMKEFDEAKLVLFSDRLLHETPFTTFPSVLTIGLAGVEAQGGTALNDHLYLALKRLDPREGRKVVILLTDGIDVDSVLEMERVGRMVEISQAVIYWIRLRDRGGEEGGHFSSWRDEKGHARQLKLLEQAVDRSGGRIIAIDRIAGVRDAFHGVLKELRDQYVLGYYPEGALRSKDWHRVEVWPIGAPGAYVRTRGRRVALGRR